MRGWCAQLPEDIFSGLPVTFPLWSGSAGPGPWEPPDLPHRLESWALPSLLSAPGLPGKESPERAAEEDGEAVPTTEWRARW